MLQYSQNLDRLQLLSTSPIFSPCSAASYGKGVGSPFEVDIAGGHIFHSAAETDLGGGSFWWSNAKPSYLMIRLDQPVAGPPINDNRPTSPSAPFKEQAILHLGSAFFMTHTRCVWPMAWSIGMAFFEIQ
jgi:hypothetical protein